MGLVRSHHYTYCQLNIFFYYTVYSNILVLLHNKLTVSGKCLTSISYVCKVYTWLYNIFPSQHLLGLLAGDLTLDHDLEPHPGEGAGVLQLQKDGALLQDHCRGHDQFPSHPNIDEKEEAHRVIVTLHEIIYTTFFIMHFNIRSDMHLKVYYIMAHISQPIVRHKNVYAVSEAWQRMGSFMGVAVYQYDKDTNNR